MEKICIELYYLKERFNEMEIEMDSENENQLKENLHSCWAKRNPSAKKLRNILACLTKVKERTKKETLFKRLFPTAEKTAITLISQINNCNDTYSIYISSDELADKRVEWQRAIMPRKIHLQRVWHIRGGQAL